MNNQEPNAPATPPPSEPPVGPQHPPIPFLMITCTLDIIVKGPHEKSPQTPVEVKLWFQIKVPPLQQNPHPLVLSLEVPLPMLTPPMIEIERICDIRLKLDYENVQPLQDPPLVKMVSTRVKDVRVGRTALLVTLIINLVKQKCTETPIVFYINGNGGLLERMVDTGADVIGLDWTVDMADGRRRRLGLFSPLAALTEEMT